MTKRNQTIEVNSSKLLNEIPFSLISDFLENATVGLHIVRSDGIIIWANKADYENIGYTAENYIGILNNTTIFI